MTSAAVMGCGSWGTALALVLADAGARVRMCARRSAVAAAINAGGNAQYLPDVPLPAAISATTDPRSALDGADLVVLAVPAQTLREQVTAWAPFWPDEALLLSASKGVEQGTVLRMSEVITSVASAPPERVVVLSGPNLAGEVTRRQPAAAVLAATDEAVAARVAGWLATGYFRPYTNVDVVGTELGGAVKNVVALAVGMAEGMGMGDNTKASLITRGLAETARLGVRLGADPQTFMGLAGVGDLVATCMSPLSRNRTFGANLGSGLSVAEVVARTRQTAEGVTSCHSVLDLARRHGVEMPIAEGVASVIDGRHTPAEVVDHLMSRSRKHERI